MRGYGIRRRHSVGIAYFMTDYSLDRGLMKFIGYLRQTAPFSVLIVILLTGVSAGQNEVSIRFEKGMVSADIRKVSLSRVLEVIREEKGIWLETGFLKDESLLDEQISLQFQDVPVQDGLERILSGINHCLVFEKGSIAGVMLFGKADGSSTYRQRRSITRRRQPLRRSPSRGRSNRLR